MPLFKSPRHTSGTDEAGARKVHFPDLSREMFLKSKMGNVVEYDVYLDILPVGPSYVTKYCSRKTQNPCHLENPVIQAWAQV